MADTDNFQDEIEVPAGDDLDPVAAYRQSLSELIFNSKPHILMLTMLAEEAKDARAAEVVECIEQRLFQVKNEVKLPTLYLIDSIVKNVPNSPYIRLFQKRVIRMFIHTFEKADEKTRVLLYKLRSTWNNYFSQDVLYNLDISVKKIDPGWPISPKILATDSTQNGRMSEREVPKPELTVTTKTTMESSSPSKNSPVKKSNVRIAVSKDSKSKGTATPAIVMITPPDLNSKRNQIEHELRKELTKISQESTVENNTKNHNHKNNKRKSDDVASSKVLPTKIKKLNEQNVAPKKIPQSKRTTSAPRRKSPTNHHSSSGGSSKNSKKSHQEEIILPAPDDVIPLGRDHHLSVAKRKDVRPAARIPEKINPMLKPGVVTKNRRRNSPLRNNRMSPTKEIESTIQTLIPSADVFVKPEVLFPPVHPDPFAPKPAIESQPRQNANYGMDRDYRMEYESVKRDVQNRFDAGIITTTDRDVLIQKAEQQFIALQNMPPPPPVQQTFPAAPLPPVGPPLNTQPPPQVMVPPAQNVPPPGPFGSRNTIEPPYGSAVILINKELCRLFYLDDITGLVCFKSHPDTPFDQLVATDPVYLEPRQVYFSGHPTKVTIDPGTSSELSFCLKFNDTAPFFFTLVPGTPPQRIKLGLPDRELIVNDCPYKAQFGGMPVSVFMECDGLHHQFLLSDSRPFLQLSDEPCYDLWNRLVNAAKAKFQGNNNAAFNYGPAPTVPSLPSNSFVANPPLSGIPPQPTNDQFASVNVPKPALSNLDSLMSKLSEVGLLSKPVLQPQQEQPPQQQNQKKVNRKRKNRERNRENREAAQRAQGGKYLPLVMNQLKQNYRFVVDQLYAGVQCTNCSLRFSNEALQDEKGKKSRYSRHLDWHFRQNRREKAKPGSNATATAQRRPWFYPLDQWIQFKEVNDDEEEESSGFFTTIETSTDAEQPFKQVEFDFSAFKDSISNFDRFMESINCDTSSHNNTNNNDCENIKNICSVTAGSDQTSNCTVCNEPFDLKWFEDEEDWRLMNAVCYTAVDADSETPTSRNFHPLCLKDFLIQQLDKENRQIDESTTNVELGGANSCSMIPGLDTPLKEEEDPPQVKSELYEEDVEKSETQQATDSDDVKPDQIEPAREQEQDSDVIDPDGGPQQDIEIESFEVKVEEFEIPIETTPAPSMATDTETTKAELGLGSESDPVSSCTDKPEPQPKRGIVIKMKRSVPSEPAKLSSGGVDQGNVSATSDDNSNHSKDLSPTIDDPTSSIGIGNDDEDGKKTKNDDDSYNKGDGKDVLDATPAASPGSDGINGSSSIKHDNDDDDRPLSSSDPNVDEGHDTGHPGGDPAATGDDDAENRSESIQSDQIEPPEPEPDPTTTTGPATDADSNRPVTSSTEPESTTSGSKINYYSRGHETSALCNIM